MPPSSPPPKPLVLPELDRLPYALYRAEQVRELDRICIEEYGIAGAVLMERAGSAAYRLLRRRWPTARDLTVVCGGGNNGGDGYVVARLALQEGLGVRVLQLGDPSKLPGDALRMAEAYRSAGGEVAPFQHLPRDTGVIVDGVLGTGLERRLEGRWAEALAAINHHPAPVLALDIPSGLHSDTGEAMGIAVEAEATLSFIGLKQGMFTGSGPDCCGEIHFDALSIPAATYARAIASARRIDWDRQRSLLGPRRRTAHKGTFGHVLVIGGAPGFSGAARLAGEAAARSGAGLVSLATHPQQVAAVGADRPELMCHAISDPSELRPLLERATVVAVGPGLGQSPWAQALFDAALGSGLPLVVDADALNLLKDAPQHRDRWVLTPHPGEAARLLGCDTGEIQRDRFQAVGRLQARYGGVAVLKGAGTLVQAGGNRLPAVCSQGNPGMASGGMGDVLTGIIAALLAQGFGLEDAACTGVCLHGAAADAAAAAGERGLLASDLFGPLRRLANP